LPGQLGALEVNPGEAAATLDHRPTGERPAAVARHLATKKNIDNLTEKESKMGFVLSLSRLTKSPAALQMNLTHF
jgi:hypothetical protein